MKEFLYQIIYHPSINRVLRHVNKWMKNLLPFQLPPSGEIEIRRNDQLLFRMATNQTSFVTKVLYYEGPDAFEYTPLFCKLIMKCKTFLDIGANTGYYSLLAGSCSQAMVYAFEPSSGPLHYLHRNVRLNQLSGRVQVVPIALGHQKGILDFFAVKSKKYKNVKHHLGGVGSLQQTRKESDRVQVEATTLDEFMKMHPPPATPVLIKIDTEGTEDLILQGGHKFIEHYKPIIICETLFNKIETKIENEVMKHGYQFFNFQDGHLHHVSTLARTSDNGVRDCFLVHPDHLPLIEEFRANR